MNPSWRRRRHAKAARLLALRRCLGGAKRGRVMDTWVEMHRARLVRRAVTVCRTAALHGRRQALALADMQGYTVQRRLTRARWRWDTRDANSSHKKCQP